MGDSRVGARRITTGLRAPGSLAAGMRALAEVVAVTLGPSGRFVVMEHRSKIAPIVTKDGVEVVRAMGVTDPELEMGLRVLRDAALDVSASVGDGTTTAIVLTAALSTRCLTLAAVNSNAHAVRNGMAKGACLVLAELAAMARPAGRHALETVARTAANGDAGIASMLVDAFDRVGAKGLIEIEMGDLVTDVLDVTMGHSFRANTLLRELLPPTGARRIENPLILLFNGDLAEFEDLLPALELARKENRPLLILADDIGEGTRLGLLKNQRGGVVDTVVAKPPMYGETREQCLADLAVLCGGTAYVENGFYELRRLQRRDLGEADAAVIDGENITLIGPRGELGKREDHIASLRFEAEQGDIGSASPTGRADFVEKLQDRLKIQLGMTATLRIGGVSDVAIKARLPLAENARRAMLAASETGVLPGGGVAMLRAAQRARQAMVADDGDELAGANALFTALEAPLCWIVRNGGYRPDEVIARVLAEGHDFYGLDLARREYGDLEEAGVLDSFRMVREILSVAVSIAGSLLTTEVLITRAEKLPNPAEFKGTEGVYRELVAEGAFE
ncbi:chaperonin GroEL [Rhodoblastus acidophilus]|uniref:Chaperonin GroEL n=1 Tax=Candidatus Rhodoblastus alkanivorans TaxID=2954117 RepID=A0ABS9ZBT2_9HYPH|nr:chaperonin GroEL [Candidatus Rhodoblastus alkanivorans]MCI4679125.1 chaperonin GroEL [Candidatus Rhodoblastus alkanivorans]MCI4684986.1 chaperonin GroEL [Candidatus Rhodoblastus alkanivorans]MDI4643104.1 chaperonin GroEL [Rhodoblastus acidophilus]